MKPASTFRLPGRPTARNHQRVPPARLFPEMRHVSGPPAIVVGNAILPPAAIEAAQFPNVAPSIPQTGGRIGSAIGIQNGETAHFFLFGTCPANALSPNLFSFWGAVGRLPALRSGFPQFFVRPSGLSLVFALFFPPFSRVILGPRAYFFLSFLSLDGPEPGLCIKNGASFFGFFPSVPPYRNFFLSLGHGGKFVGLAQGVPSFSA